MSRAAPAPSIGSPEPATITAGVHRVEVGGDPLAKDTKQARLLSRLARRAAQIERDEEALAAHLAEVRARTTAAGDEPSARPARRRRALLIINTRSGPNDDSILRVREIVERLADHGIDARVCVKLSKRQARKDARKAARAGTDLVIAAGGDGTIEAVARGLVGTKATLGIIPLGTYNNLAAGLGIPSDLAQACALIAAGPSRAIDVGVVRARGAKPRHFLEAGWIGLAAALIPAGQEAKDGHWSAAAQSLPDVAAMPPSRVTLALDASDRSITFEALVVTVANAPRAAAALPIAPAARMDDGLLDVGAYVGMLQPALAIHVGALAAGVPSPVDAVRWARARRLTVDAEPPLPVAADSKVIGTTPARFRILPGVLRVIVGHGPALMYPVSGALVAAATGAVPPAHAEPPEHSAALSADRVTRGLVAAAEPVVSFIEQRILGHSPEEPRV